MAEIKHPKTGEYILGTVLQPGDVIRQGDKYDADDGWRSSSGFVNKKLDKTCTSTWVRPA